MKVDKFKVIQYTRELLLMIDKEMENFPKKDIELKNRIRNNTYDILELNYEANSTQDVVLKTKLLNKVFAKLKIIDFLLNLSLDKKIITQKKYYKLADKIDDVLKYETGWMNQLNTVKERKGQQLKKFVPSIQ